MYQQISYVSWMTVIMFCLICRDKPRQKVTEIAIEVPNELSAGKGAI